VPLPLEPLPLEPLWELPVPDPVCVVDPVPELPVCVPLPVDPVLGVERVGLLVVGAGLLRTGGTYRVAGALATVLAGVWWVGVELGFFATAAFFLTTLALAGFFGEALGLAGLWTTAGCLGAGGAGVGVD
jgi:hypothetical protein